MMSMYVRPDKPRTMTVKKRRGAPVGACFKLPEILIVDAYTECHVTPPDVGGRMVDYLRIEPHDFVLEPQAGNGNLIASLLNAGCSFNQLIGVERHYNLSQSAKQRFKKNGNIKIINQCFLDYSVEVEEVVLFSKILMNPPFIKVKQHIASALKLLAKNGVLVALVPISFNHDGAVELEILPNDTFSTAKVNTKIIRFEKV
jgi:protein-L-isoaspartate O-methyltransferase